MRNSLSQLLNIEPHKIDLKEISWLHHKWGQKRIRLTFEHAVIPLMLFKMRTFLYKFQITPIRVFAEMNHLLPHQRRQASQIPESTLLEAEQEKPESMPFEADHEKSKPCSQCPRVQTAGCQAKTPANQAALEDMEIQLHNNDTSTSLGEINSKWEEIKESLSSLLNKAEPLRGYLKNPNIPIAANAGFSGQASTAKKTSQLLHCDQETLIILDPEDGGRQHTPETPTGTHSASKLLPPPNQDPLFLCNYTPNKIVSQVTQIQQNGPDLMGMQAIPMLMHEPSTMMEGHTTSQESLPPSERAD